MGTLHRPTRRRPRRARHERRRLIQMRPGRAPTIALYDPDRMRRLFSSGAKYRHQQEVDGPLVRLLCWEGHLSVRDQRIAEDLQHGHIVDGATRAPRTIWRLQGDLGDTHMSRWCVKNERGLRRDSPYLVPSRPPGRRLARASILRCARPCGAMPPDGDVMNGITRLPCRLWWSSAGGQQSQPHAKIRVSKGVSGPGDAGRMPHRDLDLL